MTPSVRATCRFVSPLSPLTPTNHTPTRNADVAGAGTWVEGGELQLGTRVLELV